MKMVIKIIFPLIFILSCGYSNALEKTTIYIDVVGNSKFDVIYHRAKSNATGAVIAGLIGAGVQAGVESGKDEKKTKEIQPLIEANSWKEYFLDNLNNNLESRNFEAEWIDGKRKLSEGIVLRIYPGSYGIKMVDTSTLLMSAYVDFNATLTNLRKGKKEGAKKNFYLTSKSLISYETFSADKVLLNSDLQSALTMAAKRVANNIIYSKEI